MVSIIITAYKEAKTITQCLASIADKEFSGLPENFEIILACPDSETFTAANQKAQELGIEKKLVWVEDPGKGKPTALNLAIKKATGDVLIFTDGDVSFGRNSIKNLLKHFTKEISAPLLVSGRPVSADSRTNMLGYFGHLLSDAAHHKRTLDLTQATGRSQAFVKKRDFFTVSGYIYASTKFPLEFPSDCLVDDGYISYIAHNAQGKIEYEPEAVAFVKYPTNLSDYFKQKSRSTGGFMQLWEYGVVTSASKTRSFFRELEYFWFPIYYAQNIKELAWSFMLYPIRLWLWLRIFWERKIIKKDFIKTWVRIESTK